MKQLLAILIPVMMIFMSSQVQAEDVTLSIEIPQLEVAEYHSPYVAVWLENDRRQATQVAVWYDIALANGEGQDWLKDMRQWWRRGGRALSMPVDGITGATNGPGQHSVDSQLQRVLAKLPAGDYTLMVEAAREVGGRELVQLPITLPLNPESLPLRTSGKSELGELVLITN